MVDITGTTLRLGIITVKSIIEASIRDNNLKDTAFDIIEWLDSLDTSPLEKRKINRDFEEIEERIADSYIDILKYTGLDNNSQNTILTEIIFTIKNYQIPYSKIIEKKLDSKSIYNELLISNINYKNDFDQREGNIYKRLLLHISEIIAELTVNMPDFSAHDIRELPNQSENNLLLSKMDSLNRNITLFLKKREISVKRYLKTSYSNY